MSTVPSNGFDLLNSLVSPGPATPIQSDPAWPTLQGWDNPVQGFFSQAMQIPGQVQFFQPGFLPNVQQDYIPLGEDTGEEDAYAPEVDPTFDNTTPAGAQSQQVDTTQATSMAQSSLPSKNTTEKKTVSPSQAESQKKLVELRAKLLANRPRSAASQRASTPSKSKESQLQPKNATQEQTTEDKSDGKAVQGNSKTTAPSGTVANVSSQEPSMNADIDILLAEGRSAANGHQHVQQEQANVPKLEEVSATIQESTTVASSTPGKIKEQKTDANTSSDEEGEIRGEPEKSTFPDRPYKSIESRQDTTTEAQEKIDRQLETKSAYGALKKENNKKTNGSAERSKETTKSSEGSKVKAVSPKTKREYLNAAQSKAGLHDSYRPGRGDSIRDGDQERRASGSTSQTQQETIRRLKDLLSTKDQEIDDLRREKETVSRQQSGQGLTRNTMQAQNGTGEIAETTLISDRDVADWLEMTDFYDDDFRQRRLSRFRRKQELDAARAELEREDQMDLEERTHRAHTTGASPPSFSPKVLRRASIATVANPSRMPPPPLPLSSRDISNDRVGDFAPVSQASTPTLKRQHAELDTDVQPAEKFVRTTENGTRTRGSSPTNSFRGEPLSTRFAPRPPPLEDRISRRGSDFERRDLPRRRSPSPGYSYRRPDSRERRRSFSPRPRFRGGALPPLAPERLYQKQCFKCNKVDHQQKDCPLVRRDSKDEKPRYRDPSIGFPVSQNYMGKNPLPPEELRNGSHPPPDKQLPY